MSDTSTFSRGGDFATSRRGGVTPYEIDFIRDQRAKGRSAQTIANMLGRSQEAVAAVIQASGTPVVAVERKGPPKAPPVAFSMIDLVARLHDVFPEALIAHDQRVATRNARQEAYWRLLTMRDEGGSYRWTAGQIALWFDRDESSVRQGAAAYLQRLTDQEASDLARWRRVGDAA